MAAKLPVDANSAQEKEDLKSQEIAELRQILTETQERLSNLEAYSARGTRTTERGQAIVSDTISVQTYRLNLKDSLQTSCSSSMSTFSMETNPSESPPNESFDSMEELQQLAGSKFAVNIPRANANQDIADPGPKSFAFVPDRDNIEETNVDNLDSYTLLLSCDMTMDKIPTAERNQVKDQAFIPTDNQAMSPVNDKVKTLVNDSPMKTRESDLSPVIEIKEVNKQWFAKNELPKPRDDLNQMGVNDLLDADKQEIISPKKTRSNLVSDHGAAEKTGSDNARKEEVKGDAKVNLREMVRQMSENESYPAATIEELSNLVSLDLQPNTTAWWKVYAKLLDMENCMLKKNLGSLVEMKVAPVKQLEDPMTMATTEDFLLHDDSEKDDKTKVIDHLLQQLQALHTAYKELESVNGEWLKYRQKKDEQVAAYRSQVVKLEAQVAKLEAQEACRKAETDKGVQAVKLQHQSKVNSMTNELGASRRECHMLAEQVRQLTSQLAAFTNHHIQRETASVEASNTCEQCAELLSENNAIKLQLQAFQEDFDREHAELVQSRVEREGLQWQLSSHQQRLKSAETTKQKVVEEYERTTLQLTDAKKKNRKSEELLKAKTRECDNLKRELNMLKQQQVKPQVVSPLTHPTRRSWQAQYTEEMRTASGHGLAMSGSWQCTYCTFSNAPVRTVCEVCGCINKQANTAIRTSVNDTGEVGQRLLSRNINRPPRTDSPAEGIAPYHLNLLSDSEHLNIDGSRAMKARLK